MKKLLTIMLALLVIGGVAFADVTFDGALAGSTPVSLPDSAELTIQANAPGLFNHGFSGTETTTFGGIINKTFLDGLYKTVNFTLTSAQAIGYYQIATNTRNDFSVTLSATALKSEEYITGTSTFMYVPYTLTVDETDLDVGTIVTTTAPDVADMTLFATGYLSGKTNGILAESYPLTVTFADLVDEGDEITLPEGNYTATITVTVTGN